MRWAVGCRPCHQAQTTALKYLWPPTSHWTWRHVMWLGVWSFLFNKWQYTVGFGEIINIWCVLYTAQVCQVSFKLFSKGLNIYLTMTMNGRQCTLSPLVPKCIFCFTIYSVFKRCCLNKSPLTICDREKKGIGCPKIISK